jgi:hypothetical protein
MKNLIFRQEQNCLRRKSKTAVSIELISPNLILNLKLNKKTRIQKNKQILPPCFVKSRADILLLLKCLFLFILNK